MLDVEAIAEVVDAYLCRYPGERERLAPLLGSLAAGAAVTSRSTFTGHLTCSAIVVDPRRRVLHVRHNVLGRWLRPGGHLETTDTSLLDATLRELAEETGIPADTPEPVADLPIDIDVHRVPAHPGRGEPAHDHFDVRYALTVPAGVEVTPQVEEVSDFAWVPLWRTRPAAVRAKVRRALR